MTRSFCTSRFKLDLHILVLLAFTLLSVAPLTAPGYFMFAHDARHTVYFFQMFDAALRDGALYPRWAADMTFGYGYPVWLILAPLPYYLGELFHLAGLDFVSAAKAVDGLALIASGLAMYVFAKRVLSKDAGLLAAVAYLFIPYHLVDLYVRAAGAEFHAFVFPPLIFWALYELVTTRRAFYIPVSALAYAGLVLTHVQTAILFSPFIGAYILILWIYAPREQGERWSERIARPAAAIGLGLLLSATFLLPIVFEQRFLTAEPLIGGFFNFRQHFISLAQLLSPFWGYGYAGINGGDQFSLQLGLIPLCLALVAFWGLRRNGDRLITGQVLLFGLVSLAFVLLMLSVSAPMWELAAPVVAFTQFPWRLLGLTALPLAFLAGAALRALNPEDSFHGALLFSLLLVLAMFPNARPQYTEAIFNYSAQMDFEVKDHELLGDTVWMTGARPKTSPLVEQYRAGQITDKAIALAPGVTDEQVGRFLEGEIDRKTVSDSATVQLLEHNSQGDKVHVEAARPARVMFYTRYFPGWTATIDGAPVPAAPSGEQGLVTVQVPAGTHEVEIHFGDTVPRQAGALISLVCLVGSVIWLGKAIALSSTKPPVRMKKG